MDAFHKADTVIQGTFTPNDLVSANWTHLRPRRFIGMTGLAIVALFCWALWFGLSDGATHDPPWMRFGLLGVAIYLVVTFGIWLPYRTRRTFRQRKDLQRACSFVATREGLQFASDSVQGIKPWSDYLKWREGRAVLLLYVSDAQYQIIPKRFFEANEALSEFRTMLRNSIGQPT